MTQSISRSAPALKLASMKLPEVIDWMGKPLQREVANDVLLLVPGQLAEISVQIANTGNLPLQWKLKVRGNFPRKWWEADNQQVWNLEREILSRDNFQGQICFCAPDNFFEQQTVPNEDSPYLKLNFQAEICLFTINNSGQEQLADYQAFQLWIRPDCSYLDFLPEIYQATDFMDRFLMIFEQAFDPTVQTMDAFWAFLDPLTAPKALLPFIAQWVAWNLDARWTLKQQRRLLRNAIRLYRWRGTRWGLLIYLHLYTGLLLQENNIPGNLQLSLGLQTAIVPEAEKRISVVENHSPGFVLGEAEFAQSPMIGGGNPYHFIVTLRPDSAEQIDEPLIRNIIEQVKPAFCTYDLWIINFYS